MEITPHPATQPPAAQNPWEAIFRHAVQFHERGMRDEAGSIFAAILKHNPSHLPTLQRLAAIRRQQGKLEESRALLERAIYAYPDSAEAFNSLGNTLNELNLAQEANEAYRRAIALRPEFPEAHFNLGNSLRKLSRFEDAAAAYRAAVALRPDYADAHNNLGLACDGLGRTTDALACFERAVAIDPSTRMACNNLALALADLNRHQEALPYFARARALDPDAAEPVFNESLVRLALADFESGWRDYEARWRLPKFRPNASAFAQPQWDGSAPLHGKTILLHGEQGLGDTILFARYVPLVAERGGRIILAVQDALAHLFASIPGVAQTVTSKDPLPEFDYHSPMGSLPGAFHTTLESIPAEIPYLVPPAVSPTLTALAQAADPRPTIGVCWAGNPSNPNDRNRSMRLADFAPLFAATGYRFVSLQQKLAPGDEETLASHAVDVSSDRAGRSLADTAALIAHLDLVITVDTAIAHLAGALGRKVWVLLPFRPYWVWQRARLDSPWYPTARLFRQPALGDWKTAVQETLHSL